MSEYIITTEQLNFFTGYMPDNAMIPAEMAHLQPLVRCRDCKHKETITDCAGISQMLCRRKEQVAFVIEPDGFCAWGERRQP